MLLTADDALTPARPPSTVPRVALVGHPNTGKTTVFNRLCGVRAKTANFPGTTTATRIGRSRLSHACRVDIVDLPGVYSLSLATAEAEVVRDVLSGRTSPAPDAVVVIVDATDLARHLVLAAEVASRGVPTIVCVNRTDMAVERGIHVDAAALSREIGVPVVPLVASRGDGIAALGRVLDAALGGATSPARQAGVPPRDSPLDALTGWAQKVVAAAVRPLPARRAAALDRRVVRLDGVLTHPVRGLAVFFAVMAGLFWVLFVFAAVPMGLIEATFAGLGGLVRAWLPAGAVQDLVADGVIGAVAGTVVFLPQICLLFFLISLLEDTGYLARASFVMDRFLRPFGLPGYAFVPLLTCHACAVPGIVGARLIPNCRDRLATILVAPFMSCSARLPVFVLLTSLLFADRPAVAALAFAGCYVLGAAAAFLSAALFGRTILKGKPRPIILELPPYQAPSLRNALLTAKEQGLSFLKTVGTVIVAICVVMWGLGAYPRVETPTEAATLRARAAAAVAPAEAAAMRAQADRIAARAQQQGSWAGRIGRAIEPAFAPLGFDGQLAVGLVTSFVAREVFVSTMAVLAAGPDEAGVLARIRGMSRGDGTPVFTPATSASVLVFFILAMQCLPTLAATRRETGRLRYPLLQATYMSGVAYLAAFVVYQGLRAFGVS
jgi:ferrous iron transport protein B